MSASRYDELLQPVKKGDSLRKALQPERLNAMVELLRETARGKNLHGGPGVLVSTGPAGATVRRKKPLQPFRFLKPLQVLVTAIAAVEVTLQVVPGTVCGAMPQIDTVALNTDPAPTLVVPRSGTRYITLNIDGTPLTTTLDGRVFFHPGFAESPAVEVTITSETVSPGAGDLVRDGGAFTPFKVLLTTVINGVLTPQNGFGPISYSIQDLLDGSGEGFLKLYYPG